MNVQTILLALVGVITALFGVFVYGAGIFIGATFGSLLGHNPGDLKSD
jgi:hypothetical protein